MSYPIKRDISVRYTPYEVEALKNFLAVFDEVSRDATYCAQVSPDEWRRLRDLLGRPIRLFEKRANADQQTAVPQTA